MSLTPRHTSCRYPLDLLGESPCQGVEWTLHPLNRLLYTLLYRGKAPLRLASLLLFPRSQVRRCHPIRFHFESISFPFLFRMIGTGFAFLYQALIPSFCPDILLLFSRRKASRVPALMPPLIPVLPPVGACPPVRLKAHTSSKLDFQPPHSPQSIFPQ
jgi:hypothetical protein